MFWANLWVCRWFRVFCLGCLFFGDVLGYSPWRPMMVSTHLYQTFHDFNIKLSNRHVVQFNIHSKTMETFLSNQTNGIKAIIRRKTTQWQNVLNAEPKFQNQRRHGKWQVAQTKLANVCNLKLACTNVPNAATYSAKF
jgi:hypothetical protein